VLNELRVENFKSLEEATISPKLITVFIGPNGGGKSSIIQALILLKQSRHQAGLQFGGPIIQFGDFYDIVARHELDRAISFSLTGTVGGPEGKRPEKTPETTFTYRLVYDKYGIARNVAELRSEQHPAIREEWVRGPSGPQRSLSLGRGFHVLYNSSPVVGTPMQFAAISPPGGVSPEEVDRTTRWIQDIFLTVIRAMEQMFFVPPNRGFDQTGYGLIPAPVTDFMSHTGTTQQSATLAGSLVYKRELVERRLSDLMALVTGVALQAPLVPGPRVVVMTSRDGFSSVIVNEGFVSNQLVMLLATLLDAPEGSLVAIEEPEIHLHPRAQASLAEALVETALLDHKQLLLTTHSEHLLVGFLTSVATGRLRPEQLALYYVDRPEFETRLKSLPVDELGRVAGGLEGFFEADVQQVQSYLQALTKKLPQRPQ